MKTVYKELVSFIKELYQTDDFIPLHEPTFQGNEKAYVNECIDSTFVSSVGKFVDKFEDMVADYTGAKYAIATVNGTAALHVALKLVGVEPDTEVITQPLTFVATCNSISYCGALPVFVDVDLDTLGMSPSSLELFLKENTVTKENQLYNKNTKRRISAVLPMHTFGHPCRIAEIAEICEKYSITLVEDAAESLGSFYKGQHTGTFGTVGAFSFNGNKIITSGGGGVFVTDDEKLAKRAKHITTTAKIPHPYEFVHDEIAYNFRMPNINAALGCAQIEKLPKILNEKRILTSKYHEFCTQNNIQFIKEPAGSKSNYWLNAICLPNKNERDEFLKYSNSNNVMSRPIWKLMNHLDIYQGCQIDALTNALCLEERIVNLPSTPIFL